VPHFISQTDSSSVSIGILNLECAVRPSGSNNEATPDDATVETIFLCDLRNDTIVFQRNVLPVPPWPHTKKKSVFFLEHCQLFYEMHFSGLCSIENIIYLLLFLKSVHHILVLLL
jgi:hypothetical protein